MEKQVQFNRDKMKRTAVKIFFTVLIGLVALSMVTPFIWMVSASMKLPLDVMKLPIKWIPEYFYPDNYKKVWNIGGVAARDYHFGLAYFNSIKIAVINLTGSVITSTLAGYAFAKIKFRGSNVLFLLYLATMMIPSQVTLMAKCVLFNKMQIPDELRESARVDGANEYVIWARIMVPIAKPSMASLAMVVFLWNWNSYLEPLVFLSDWRLYTIPIALTNFIEESVTEYNLVMAAASSALIPAFLVFVLGQKFLVKGLVAGAVKG